MDLLSSKTAHEFIDLTILNTPKPQASSTVERKGVHSYRNNKANKCEVENIKPTKLPNMDIPTRDIDNQSNSSQYSTISSLGILSMDNIEDIKEALTSKKQMDDPSKFQRKSNISDSLALQRLLAQKAIEKVDSKTKGNVGGLPSYLLNPSGANNNTVYTATPMKNESTINMSDLERSLPPKTSHSDRISFEVKEISARSSSLGNQKDHTTQGNNNFTLRSPSPVRGVSNDFSAKYDDICEKLRQSYALCNQSRSDSDTHPLASLPLTDIDTIDLSSSCVSWTNALPDSLVSKLQNELFTPAELAGDKLLADELSWRKAKDILPVESYNTESNKMINFSGLSGYMEEAEISLASKGNEKVSISDFFSRRNEKVEHLNLKSSPEKKFDPVPLIDLTNNSNNDNVQSDDKPDTRMSTSSILSVSQIAHILSKMDIQESPTRALNMLLKKSNISDVNTPNTVMSDCSTLKNTPSTPSFSPNSRNDKTLKENIHNNSNIKSPRKYNNEEILRNMTNLRNKKSEEWTDAKTSIAYLSDINRTVSSIAESPSYSCSELEFSEDEKMSSASSIHSDEWLHIDSCKSHKLYVDVSQNIPITLLSKTNHWLHIKLSIKHIMTDIAHDNCMQINILNNKGVLKPCVNDQFLLKIMCLVSGKFKVIIKIEIANMITRAQQILEHILIIEAEEPKVKPLTEELDFKLNPEGTIKRLMLPIVNETETTISLSLTIIQQYEWVFVFGSNTESNSYDDNKVDTDCLLTIPAGGTVSVPVEMRSLALEDLGVPLGVDSSNIVANINMKIVDSTKILHQISLIGRVGFTKVQFKTSCMPFVLFPGQTKPLQVRNSGIVPMELLVSVDIPENESCIDVTSDNLFTIDTSNLTLKPGQIGTVNITFNARDKYKSVRRVIRLDYPRGPSFKLPIEGMLNSRSPDIKVSSTGPGISPRRERPASGSSGSSSHSSAGSLHNLPDGKLPIESTRTELVWGCVRPGRVNTQDFVLRNRCSQRVRLQSVIHGSLAFKFIKDHSESTTSMNLVLHGMESRTISVSFCPTNKGAASARLMFLPIEQDASYSKRQMIQLYGYGGYTAVDVQKVAKDTSGRMWLSFGRLNYEQTLHQMFILRNTGSLTAFVCLSITCKVIYPFMDTNVSIYPTEAVIEPNKEVEISVNFSPKRDDFKYIQKSTAGEVSEIASIKIMTGPEPTRGRIRRLFNKLNTTNGSGVMNQLSSAFVVPRLSSIFPNERIASDVAMCRESSGALRDLLRDVNTRDLVLTVEWAGPDCTAAGVVLDDTLMFQSLVVADTTALSITGRTSGGFCSVDPRRLTLFPTEQGTVLVRSHHSRPMPFEVCIPVSATDIGLQATPLVGVLAPGEIAAITVFCTSAPPRLPYTCIFMVYVENEVMEIELKIQSRS